MRIAAAILWAAVCGACVSCASDPTRGYSLRPGRSERFTSVAVPVFENTTFTQGLESALTEAVVKEIQRTTSWAVTDASTAQTILLGTVVGSELRPITYSRNEGLVQETAVRITVDFDLRDNRTGKVVRSRRGFSASETFVPARPSGERIELGQAAAIDQLARDVVAELRSSW